MKNPLGPPMQRLIRIAQQREKIVAGLISGTSADGIDAALVKITGCGVDTGVRPMAFQCHPYPDTIREHLLAVSRPGAGSVDQICRLNIAVGECFAQAALNLMAAANLRPEQVDLIGSHGQTIHHLPNSEPIAGTPSRGTLQIGEPSVIAKRTGVITVADFRPADMALGGQGAPLAPLMDYLLFRSAEKSRGVLNLGGIANLTFLKKNGTVDEVVAFDTGPANMVIDGLMQKLFGRRCDENGEVAGRGSVSRKLLRRLLKHPYFSRPFPKSSGREDFGEAFVDHILRLGSERNLRKEDLVATATALTVQSVGQAVELVQSRYGRIDELIVSGGGVHNLTLMNSLRDRLSNMKVSTTSEYGVAADAKEAILFAVLANETVSGHSGNLPAVTGAKEATVLGKICL